MRISKPPFLDVIRCHVYQRDGRRWYTITNANHQRPSSNSTNAPPDAVKTELVSNSNSNSNSDPALPFSFTKRVEPFDLPRVVIDLDAIDSPNVVTTTKPHKLQIHPREWRDMRKHTDPVPMQTHKSKFGATLPEILAYTLLGDSSHSDTLQSKYMQTFLRARRLHTTPTEQDHINNLALDIQLDPVERLGDEASVLERRIQHCGDIVQLRRIVDILSTTLEGCQILRLHLAAATWRTLKTRHVNWREEFPGKKATNLEMLVLINNTCTNMISRGLTPHHHLVHAALYHASKCESLPAIRQYLSLSFGEGREFGRAMRHLQLCLVRTKQSAPATNMLPWMGREDREKELLKLLTGWEHGDKPTQGESRGLSFALLSPVFSHNHSLYIIGLGEAGLCEALNAEWKIVYQENVLSKFLWSSQLFATAYLLANKPGKAKSILAAVPRIMKKVDFATAQYQNQAHVKYQPSPVLLHKIPRIMNYLVLQHYNFHGVRASPALGAHCMRTIERVQHLLLFNPTQAFRELNSLLVLGFSGRGPFSPLPMTWGDIPASVKEGNEVTDGSSLRPAPEAVTKTSPGEIQTPLGVDFEKTEKFMEDETILGLSDKMCGLFQIRKWSALADPGEQMGAYTSGALRGLVVENPRHGSPVFVKPFVRPQMLDERV